MLPKKVNQTLLQVARNLHEVREALFNCSRDCIKADEGAQWQVAEKLFSLAKDADLLRRQTVSLKDGTEAVKTKGSGIRDEDSKLLKRKRKEDYPKYGLRGDALVKTGLSRDKRTEYEHVVPRKEFETIIERLGEISLTHSQFTTEDVQHTLSCPVYQTYVVLSLLRNLGFLSIERKGKYSFPAEQTFEADPDKIWKQVPRM